MRVIIQRVSHGSVSIKGEEISSISKGFVVLVGIGHTDDDEDIEWLVSKIKSLRIFEDDQGKMNMSIQEIGGCMLVISQFTLFASIKKGNRPSFMQSAKPDKAEGMYNRFVNVCRSMLGEDKIKTGVFGGDMKVGIINNGPVTIFIDSKNRE